MLILAPWCITHKKAIPGCFVIFITVELRFNEPLYNEVLGITNDFLQPGQRYNKMYGITNTIKKRNVEYNMSTCDRKIAKGECKTDQ